MAVSNIALVVICAAMGFGVVYNILPSRKGRFDKSESSEKSGAQHDRSDANEAADWQRSTALSCYAVLGVEPSASRDEIKAAYMKLIQQYHPDRYASAAPEIQDYAARKAQAINSAYAIAKSRA